MTQRIRSVPSAQAWVLSRCDSRHQCQATHAVPASTTEHRTSVHTPDFPRLLTPVSLPTVQRVADGLGDLAGTASPARAVRSASRPSGSGVAPEGT